MQWGHGDEAVEEGPLLVPLESEPHGFNGATAMKPWKRPTSRSDVATTCLLQWGHGDEAVEENRIQDSAESFYLLQWGHGDEAVEEVVAFRETVKKGKLQWGHGDEAVEESQSQRRKRHERKCFNGATAMKPWKSLMNRIHELESQLLQWGHGDEAVEDLAFDVKSNA